MKDQTKVLLDFTRNLESEFSDLSTNLGDRLSEFGEKISRLEEKLETNNEYTGSLPGAEVDNDYSYKDLLGDLKDYMNPKFDSTSKILESSDESRKIFEDSLSEFVSKTRSEQEETLDSIISKIDTPENKRVPLINFDKSLSSISNVISDTLKREEVFEQEEQVYPGEESISLEDLREVLSETPSNTINEITENLNEYVESNKTDIDYELLSKVISDSISGLKIELPSPELPETKTEEILNTVERLSQPAEVIGFDPGVVNEMFEKTQSTIGDLLSEFSSFGETQTQMEQEQNNIFDSTNTLIKNSFEYQKEDKEPSSLDFDAFMDKINLQPKEEISDYGELLSSGIEKMSNLLVGKIEYEKEPPQDLSLEAPGSNLLTQEITNVINKDLVESYQSFVSETTPLSPFQFQSGLDISSIESPINLLSSKIENLISSMEKKETAKISNVSDSPDVKSPPGNDVLSNQVKEPSYDFKKIESSLSLVVSLLENLNSSMSRPVYVKDYSPNRPNSKFS